MTPSTQQWNDHPNIFEINTWVWLNELSTKFDEEITLNNVPEEKFENFLRYFDAIWLMGVWDRSPESRNIAKTHEGLQKEFHTALDDYTEDDVIGSPYAVYYYHADSRLGGKDGLKRFRKKLNMRDIKLILDYIPNHVSRDHLWTLEKSNIFIEGTKEDLEQAPNEYFEEGRRILAHGKDPYFPPWTDTVQINAFSQDARQKAVKALLLIADQCDAVRCDMAMLMTNEVFSKTWGEKAGSPPEKEYWEYVIPRVKEKYPDFKFIGEVYWDMEWKLMQQGFDFCYDKRLYDRIMDKNVTGIKQHLTADFTYQEKLLRFIENHDEPRILDKMDIEPSLTATCLILTLPGMGLIHEGQMKGYKRRVPVQLKRREKEEVDFELVESYRNILNIISEENIKEGKWELCDTHPENNELESSSLITYHWWNEEANNFLVVINLLEEKLKANIRVPSLNISSDAVVFSGMFNKESRRYTTTTVKKSGLDVELDGWGKEIFKIKPG